MYCVIQQIEKKKQNKCGYPKELRSEYMQSSLLGSYYYYTYSEERFERPIKKAYRISLHESYRQDGKVKKRQFLICTVDYYDFATDFFNLYDYGGRKIAKVAEQYGVDEDTLYGLINTKLEPLIAQIVAEFQETEEYAMHQEHERITTIYAARKVKFNEQYGFQSSSKEYDKCYDVFGELRNPEYLKKIQQEYQNRKEYEEKSRSYYEKFRSNYTNGSYSDLFSSNHSEKDKDVLKQFYRVLSKKFHPDVNPDIDTSEQMKVLNQLKQEWGL